MAGGKGERLFPLTKNRAKPSVHFGGKYRIIDFVINNFINSGFFKIKVLTQYKSTSLVKHLSKAWSLSQSLGMFVDPVPAQMRKGEVWYRGTADAVSQNINEIYDTEPEYIAVFGGDHIYKMDVKQMLDYHISKNAVATVSAIPVRVEEAKEFGIIGINGEGKINGFFEKPDNPPEMPNKMGYSLASMGNYIFSTEFLKKIISDYVDGKGYFDFGKDIFPNIIDEYPVYAYDFYNNVIPGQHERERAYWKDVGSIDSYWQANMEMRDVYPIFDLYNKYWPIRTNAPQLPPAKFVFSGKNGDARRGEAVDSLIGEGTIVSGSRVKNSVISFNCFLHSYSEINDSIIFPDCAIGRHVRLNKVIVDRNVRIPEGISVGYNIDRDKKNFHVSSGGVVVIPQDFDWQQYK